MIDRQPSLCSCCRSAAEYRVTRRRLLAAAVAFAIAPGSSKSEEAPEIRYDSVPNPVHLPPNVYLNACSGVALNSRGHVFVLSRCNRAAAECDGPVAQLLEFGPNGNFIRELGRGLNAWSIAHTVKVDQQDNIWVTDRGSDVVIRFNPEGRITMVLGSADAAEPGAAPPPQPAAPPPARGRFGQVTDVAWDSMGNAYISDGHVNARIVKIDSKGQWLTTFGEPGSGQKQFRTPHSIAVDASDRIYVADRDNRRIQVLSTDGDFKGSFTIDVPAPADALPLFGDVPDPANPDSSALLPGAPWALCITPGRKQVLYCADAFPGRIYKLSLDGKLLGVLGESGRQPKQFGWIHEMASPAENVLFVSELLNWRIQKLVLRI